MSYYVLSHFSFLQYQAGSGVCLPKAKLLSYLLEGTAGSHVGNNNDEEKDVIECSHDGISAGIIFLNQPCHFLSQIFVCIHVCEYPPYM